MRPRQRRFLYYVAAFAVAFLVYTVAYSWAMAAFEGESRSLVQSALTVVETFTTTGYGEDANIWSSPQVIGLVIAMQFTGVFFIFMALPLFVAPWLEERLTRSLPTALSDYSDHVVICSYTQRSRTLIDELEALDVEYVVVERDREEATDLMEDDVPVVHGNPESADALEGACLSDARALVADVDDETNASIALAADEAIGEADVRIITFVENPDVAEYHRYAGADHVFTPRELIGKSLANKVSTAATAEVEDAVEIGENFEIAELPVQPGSELDGVRVADSEIRERTGANVIGAWFRGEFVSPPDPDDVIDGRTVLLVAGHDDELEALNELTRSERRRLRQGQVLICGYGEVGSTIKQSVTAAGLPCVAIDLDDKPGVDIVGDVTEADVLEQAGIHEASTVILALSDDTVAIFATLVIRQLDVDVEVVARANATDSIRKLYRAGADYVLALSTVSGRMLAATILEGQVMSVGQQIEVIRTGVGRLAGETLAEADIRARTGCTVVAVARNGSTLTGLDPDFRFERGDRAVVIGPDDGIARFSSLTGDTDTVPVQR
jgi:Trk K+ transport system NAD-binding subunit